MKICNKCNIKKAMTEFNFRKDTNKHRNECKECKSLKNKKYVQDNYEKVKQITTDYRHKNSENIKIKMREYRKDNPEVVRATQKRSRTKNIDKARCSESEYYYKNKESILKKASIYHAKPESRMLKQIIGAKRRALKTSTEDRTVTTDSTNRLLEEQGGLCVLCKCTLDRSLKYSVHLDHIIPLSKGGSHSICNVQWLCKRCNQSKSNKLD